MSLRGETDREPSKLIVTLFSNSRCEKIDKKRDRDDGHPITGDFQQIQASDVSKFLTIGTSFQDGDDLLTKIELLEPNPARLSPHVCQFSYKILRPVPDFRQVRLIKEFQELEKLYDCEVIIDRVPFPMSFPEHRRIRLALFDMDSTLINEEVIDELARTIGKTEAVSAITTRAMNGEIDFATSLEERVAMLKGVRADVWDELKGVVTIANGARELIRGLKDKGVITGVISGGFIPMAEWLKEELGLDYAFANHLLTSPPTPIHPYPHLTGALSPDYAIIDPDMKMETLFALAKSNYSALCETLAVGDGSNDLLMLHAAGIGVAYNAKRSVQEKAPMRLNGESLAELLYLFGSR